jgi:signal transduction histidine kinase
MGSASGIPGHLCSRRLHNSSELLEVNQRISVKLRGMNLDIPPLRPHQRRATNMVGLWLAAPLAAIVATLLVAAYSVVGRSADKLDNLQAKNELTLARTAFLVEAQPIVKSIEDYAHWDDAYDQTIGKIDLTWAEGNLGPFLIELYGLTHFFVLDDSGGLRYAAVSGKGGPVQAVSETAPEVSGLLTDDIRKLSADVLAAARGGDVTGQQGFMSYLGRPTFVAVRAIRPHTVARLNQDKSVRSLILVKVLSDERVAEIGAAFGLAKLQFSETAKLKLAAPGKAFPALGVKWDHHEVGEQFATDVVVEMLPFVLIASALMILSLVGWSHAFGIIQKAEIDALDERAKSVQDTARAKAFFVANMSHELRTPLNAIIGFSDVIKSEMLGKLSVPKYLEYAADINASGNHLLGIVNNILTLSKIEAQHQKVSIEPVRVAETISHAIRMVQPDAAKRQIEIVQSMTDAPLVSADPRALTQIVVNLLSNATKFSDVGGAITVCVAPANDGQSVQLTVTDQGCGIPKHTLEQLGRPFTQAEDPLRRNFQGTGLGLSICFALARQMNCELRIQSEVNHGTVATLEMPVSKGAGSISEASPPQSERNAA